MDVAEAWTKASGTGVTVGIVDTGVLTTHPDLANQIATNPGEIGTDALEPRQALQRRRRRRQRLQGRLAGLGLRRRVPEHRRLRGRQHPGPRQRPAGQPRPRHARRRHRRRAARQQRGHRRRRARRADHAAARARRHRPRLQPRDRRGVRLRGQDGRARGQREPRRPGPGPVAAGGDPGAPEHALRDRGGQRQRQRRLHALRPVRAAGGQRPVRRRLGLQRREGVVLQLRRAGRRRVRAGHDDPLDLPLAHVRLPAGHLDGQPEHGRRRGAGAVGAPGRRARSTSRARSWPPPTPSPT